VNSFLVAAAIIDVGAALIVPFEVINELGEEDIGPTYLCLRGGEPLHKRDLVTTAPAAVDRAKTIRVLAVQFHGALHIVEAFSAGEV
jgi:hypothetical protein